MKNIYLRQDAQIKALELELAITKEALDNLINVVTEEKLDLEELELEIEELEDEIDEMDAREELRDWFAGLAMQSLITIYENEAHVFSITKKAYKYADAILEAKEM